MEFYIALVKFTNYKLFSDLGLPYPIEEFPTAAMTKDGAGGQYLDVDKIQEFQTHARKMFEAGDEDETNVVDKAF